MKETYWNFSWEQKCIRQDIHRVFRSKTPRCLCQHQFLKALGGVRRAPYPGHNWHIYIDAVYDCVYDFVYVYVYIYVYDYVYIYLCVYISVCLCICTVCIMYAHLYAHTYECIYICIHVFMYGRMLVRTHVGLSSWAARGWIFDKLIEIARFDKKKISRLRLRWDKRR